MEGHKYDTVLNNYSLPCPCLVCGICEISIFCTWSKMYLYLCGQVQLSVLDPHVCFLFPLQNDMPEEELLRLLSGFGLQEGAEGEGMGDADFFPMMQGMMKSLLSKDVLYPSLKEITGKVGGCRKLGRWYVLKVLWTWEDSVKDGLCKCWTNFQWIVWMSAQFSMDYTGHK